MVGWLVGASGCVRSLVCVTLLLIANARLEAASGKGTPSSHLHHLSRSLLQDTAVSGSSSSGQLAFQAYEQLYASLNASEADTLAYINSLSGIVVLLGQPQYQIARNLTQTVNSMFNTVYSPLLIAYCNSEQDVAATVAFAAARGLPLCVRAGGHATNGGSLCNGVVLDVTKMKQIEVSPDKGQAAVQVGVRFQQLTAVLAAQGLAALQGDCSGVGIAGYTLGGGWGKLSKSRGLGIDNVLAYTVALADGRLVTANDTNEFSDLFWALRGAGHGSYGVVTSILYRVFPMREVLVYNATYPVAGRADLATQVLMLYQNNYLNQPPLELSLYPHFTARMSDPGSEILVVYGIFTDEAPGAEERLWELMRPFDELAPQSSYVTRQPWAALEDMLDPLEDPIVALANPPQSPIELWEVKRGQYVSKRLTEGEMLAIVEGWMTWPAYPSAYPPDDVDAVTYAYFEGMEGAVTQVLPNATAFVHRSVGFDIVVDSFFKSYPGAIDAAQAWLNGLYDGQWAGIQGGEAYQNYPSITYGDRALGMYYGSNLCRLVGIKRKYDPENVFRGEQTIPVQLESCPEA